jgi:lipid A ethanolaminephosphotransferase
MMGNVFDTNAGEAVSYLHPRLLVYLLLFGVLPCWLIYRPQVQNTSRLRRLGFLFMLLLVGAGWIYAASSTWLWIDQNSRRLGGITMPWSYIGNAVRVAADRVFTSREQQLLPVANFASHRKTIVVLVIGESARPQSFSLYGYARPTNPQLATSGVVVLPHAHGCATYTTASVRCILSPVETGWGAAYEPLPSYLQRHGVDVIWRTNNWGEPSLKVQTYQRAEELPGACHGDDCRFDEVLLTGLERRIRSSGKDRIFIVLHQHGSHGPSYYREYPPAFEVFKPACKSVDLHECSNQALINAYDNTILYTDDFLHRAIELLKAMPDTATMLMYISDHGESLGEYGLYLHGTPYAIAPEVQQDVPFLVWMSDAYRQHKQIAPAQLAPATAHSQANVFHSIMGAFDMHSAIYRRELDIFQ